MALFASVTEEDLTAIAARYGLRISHADEIAAGSSNSTYLVRAAQDRYILTLFQDQTVAQVDELGRLLAVLDDHGFQTTRPVRASDGAVRVIHGGRAAMLKEYIDGRVHDELTPEMLRQLGTTIAQLHQVPPPHFLSATKFYGTQKNAIVSACGLDAEFEAWVVRRNAHFATRMPQGLPQGLIHGDIFADNVLFKNGRLAAIIDFEEASVGDLVFDLAVAIVGTCVSDLRISMDRAGALIRGYNQLRPLRAEEMIALKLLAEYAAVGVSCWRYWRNYIDAPGANLAASHLEMRQIAEDIRQGSASAWAGLRQHG